MHRTFEPQTSDEPQTSELRSPCAVARWSLGASMLALVLALLVLSIPAEAQEVKTPKRPEEGAGEVEVPSRLGYADLKVGPFLLQPSFSVRDLGWTDNVVGDGDDQLQIAEVRARLAPALTVLLPLTMKDSVSVDGEVEYLWFERQKELQGVNLEVGAAYEHAGEDVRLRVDSILREHERGLIERLTAVDDAEADGEFERDPSQLEFDQRIRQRQQVHGLSIDWSASESFFVRARTRRRIFENTSLVAGEVVQGLALDRTEQFAGGALGVRLSPQTAVGFDVDWTRFEFARGESFRDADALRLAAILELSPTTRFANRVLVGYRELRPREPGIAGFEGIVAEGRVAVGVGERVRVLADGGRDIFPSTWFDNVYAVRQGLHLGTELHVREGLTLWADASYFEHRYDVPSASVDVDGTTVELRRLDRLSSYGAGFQWTLNRHNSVNLRLTQFRRDSNFDTQDVESVIISTGYTIRY